MIVILVIVVLAATYFVQKSIKKYLYYLELLKKDNLSVEEKIWIYCYKNWFEVLDINGSFYISRWDNDYCDYTGYWWTTHSLKMKNGKHKSLDDVLKTLEGNLGKRFDKSNVVISSSTIPKQPNDEYLSLKKLIAIEENEDEREILQKILDRLKVSNDNK